MQGRIYKLFKEGVSRQEFFGGRGFRVLEKAIPWEFSYWQLKKPGGGGNLFLKENI